MPNQLFTSRRVKSAKRMGTKRMKCLLPIMSREMLLRAKL